MNFQCLTNQGKPGLPATAQGFSEQMFGPVQNDESQKLGSGSVDNPSFDPRAPWLPITRPRKLAQKGLLD